MAWDCLNRTGGNKVGEKDNSIMNLFEDCSYTKSTNKKEGFSLA